MAQRKVRAPSRLDAAGLWELALKSLTGRAYSNAELRQKLQARALNIADVDTALLRLKEYGYIDDKRFAERFAAFRLEDEGLGKRRVSNDLRRRRIAPALAASAVEKIYKEVDETNLIEEYIRRKYRRAPRQGLFHTQKELASAYRRLVGAGFASGGILKVLKRFAANPDLLDDFDPPVELSGDTE
ncbi:MAG: regulatory protein RecX [Candidatus Solibacter usitatus]|nr:regulatory protein RecX [Candidatus Solibacter usitatus]